MTVIKLVVQETVDEKIWKVGGKQLGKMHLESYSSPLQLAEAKSKLANETLDGEGSEVSRIRRG